jgi:hypothetical protein
MLDHWRGHLTRTTIHCGKTDAMFNYLDRVKISYIMTQGSKNITEQQTTVP